MSSGRNIDARWVLVAAVVIVVVLPQVPFLSMVLRPLGWLGTLAHETGHGLGAVAMGGHIESIQVFMDGSGVAHSSYPSAEGWRRAFVSLAGLIGPAVASVGLLWAGLGPRLCRTVHRAARFAGRCRHAWTVKPRASSASLSLVNPNVQNRTYAA